MQLNSRVQCWNIREQKKMKKERRATLFKVCAWMEQLCVCFKVLEYIYEPRKMFSVQVHGHNCQIQSFCFAMSIAYYIYINECLGRCAYKYMIFLIVTLWIWTIHFTHRHTAMSNAQNHRHKMWTNQNVYYVYVYKTGTYWYTKTVTYIIHSYGSLSMSVKFNIESVSLFWFCVQVGIRWMYTIITGIIFKNLQLKLEAIEQLLLF